MSATDVPPASTATPGRMPAGVRDDRQAVNGDGIGGARLLLFDMSVRSLLIRDARQRAVTRIFGVPRDDQSFLVTLILISAAGTVVWGLAPRPLPRPSGRDAAIGGSLLNATFSGIAGAPSQTVPLAGALIAFAVLSRSLRPAVAVSARELRAVTREFRQAFGARYGH